MTLKRDTNTIYGVHAVLEAINSHVIVNKIIVQKGLRNDQIEQVIQVAKQAKLSVQFIPKEAAVFPPHKNHQGVLALTSPIVYHRLENIIPQLFEEGKVPMILVLDHITDVRNFGAIARSAYCGGIHAIVIPEQGSAPVNDDAVKTSAGALLKIPVCRERNFKSVMELLNQSGITTIGFSEKANKELPFVDLTHPVAIIMGNEEKGLSSDVLKRCTLFTKIPMDAGVSSLNVSVAAGIAIYETVRQRMAL